MSDSKENRDVFLVCVNFCCQLHLKLIDVIAVKHNQVKVYMLLYILLFAPT